MAIHSLTLRKNHTYILICVDEASGLIYAKIGRSEAPLDRVADLKTGCPFRVSELWVAQANAYREAIELETALHRHFRERRTSGEWFRFNLADPEDKAAFHAGLRHCVALHMPHVLKHGWTRVDMVEYQKQQNSVRYLHAQGRSRR